MNPNLLVSLEPGRLRRDLRGFWAKKFPLLSLEETSYLKATSIHLRLWSRRVKRLFDLGPEKGGPLLTKKRRLPALPRS